MPIEIEIEMRGRDREIERYRDVLIICSLFKLFRKPLFGVSRWSHIYLYMQIHSRTYIYIYIHMMRLNSIAQSIATGDSRLAATLIRYSRFSSDFWAIVEGKAVLNGSAGLRGLGYTDRCWR